MKREQTIDRPLGHAAAAAGLGGAVLVSAALCAERAWRVLALEAVVRSDACGGALDSAFALGQCWHCYGVAASALFVAGIALIARER